MYTFEKFDPITRLYYQSELRFPTLAEAYAFVDRHYPWRTTRVVAI